MKGTQHVVTALPVVLFISWCRNYYLFFS